MKNLNLLLLLFLFQACSGGGGDSSPIAKAENLDSIINEIETEMEDIEKVNSVLESSNITVGLKQPDNIDRDFDIQVTPVINQNDVPYLYLFSHKRKNDILVKEPFSVFKLNLFTEEVTSFESPELQESFGRFYRYFGGDNIVTFNPINILALENGSLVKKSAPWAEPYRIHSAVKNGNNICGLARSGKLMAFNYNTNSGQVVSTPAPVDYPIPGKLQRTLACFANSIHIVIKSDTALRVYDYNFSNSEFTLIKDIQDLASRVYFYYRDNINYLAIRDSQKAWERFSNNGAILTSVSSIPKATANPFARVRRYLSYEDSNVADPHYYIQVEDIKAEVFETPKKIKVVAGNNFNPAAKRIIKKDGRLFIVSKRTNTIYEYDSEDKEFVQLGNPLAYGVYDLAIVQDEVYLSVSGNHILKYNELAPWTYGKLEHRKLKRNAVEHNPSIYTQFPDMNIKNIPMVRNNGGDLLFHGILKDRAGSILFNYDLQTQSNISTYQSHPDLNIASFQTADDGFVIGTRFNKKRADVQEGLSAELISLDKNLIETEVLVPRPGLSQAINKFVFSGKTFFMYGNQIHEYKEDEQTSVRINYLTGVRSANVIPTANQKLLYISNGKVRIYNPVSRIEVDLYVLPEEKQITKIRFMKLFNNSLFFLDQNGVVNEITLKYSDLNLKDEAND